MEVEDKRAEKLACAKLLAEGSFGTARDLGVFMLSFTAPELAVEIKHLALNFQRIAELITEATDDQAATRTVDGQGCQRKDASTKAADGTSANA